MNGNVHLVPVNLDIFESGMRINFSMYTKGAGGFRLLCKNATLNDDLIKRLRELSSESDVYIPKEYMSQVISASSYFTKNQKELEEYIGYPEIKKETANMLDIVAMTNIVPADVAENITKTLNDKLNRFEASNIIQCLNGMRNVDEYLCSHSANVAMINGLMGKWIGLSEDDEFLLVQTGLVHDIGKLSVPPEILNKPGKLTADEFNEMKKHSVYSYNMLIASGVKNETLLMGVKQHHEKTNGFGYPDGLRTDQISLFARITSIADVYDAMISKRVYKDAHSPFEILHQFSIGRFSDLDIDYVNVFLLHMPLELTGKMAVLSNGMIAKVVYVNPTDYSHPIIELDGKVLVTNNDLYCVSMYFDKLEK